MEPFFDVVVTAEDITRSKPDPDPYFQTTRRLGRDPGVCLVVEDSKNGILSARAAGCVVVGLTTSFNRAELKEAGADYVVDSYSELTELLELERRRGFRLR